MRILTLARDLPFFPGGHGGNTRAFYLIRELSNRHRFSIVTQVHTHPQEAAVRDLRRYAERVEYYRSTVLDEAMNDTAAFAPAASRWRRGLAGLRRDPLLLAIKLTAYVRAAVTWWPAEARLWELAYFNMRPAVERCLDDGPYDILQIECSDNASWVTHIPFAGAKILDVHDVKTILWWRRFKNARRFTERLHALNETIRFWLYEQRYCRRFDHLMVMSETDRAFLQRLTGHPSISVVPNGVDTTYFSPVCDPPEAKRIVFSATLDHPPNTDGILYFARSIWPLVRAAEPEATLDIVGSNPPPNVQALAGPGVRVTGFVPDIRPYLAAASIVICPLRFASGTRLKILEAMAMGKAVVATRVGAEGIDCMQEEEILLADEPAEFANKVVRLLRDPAARDCVGVAARGAAERFSWTRVGERLDATYTAVRRARAAQRASAPLRIGLNGSFLVPGGATGGLEPYFHNLVSNLLRLDHDSQYVLVANPANILEFGTLHGDNLRRYVVPPTPSLRQLLRDMAGRWALQVFGRTLPPVHGVARNGLFKLGLDLIHCIPGYIDAYAWNVPCVLTVADIQHEYYPEFFDAAELEARRSLFGPSAQRALRVIAISEFTRLSLITRLGIAPDKVSVIPLGVNPRFFAAVSPQDLQRVRRQYRLPDNYCVYSANLWPHKNHVRLLTALASMDRKQRPHLVLTGSATRTRIQLREEVRSRGLEDSVSWLGFVPAADLPVLFAGARFMVFPSLFEGFGMPVVEAMAAGCPVACANATSLPEVAGDAALLFDPLAPDAIAAALDRMWHDAALRERLVSAGRPRARQFTWRRVAVQTLQLYRETAALVRGVAL